MTDKWGRRLFKAGAVALLILGLVHSLSLIREQVPANETEKQLLGLMSGYRFNLMGSIRTMNDLVRGFSVSFMLAALGFALFDLLLFRERAGLLKRAALANIIWLAAMTAVALRYFFIIPISFFTATLLIFVLAWLKLPSEGTT
ncbi:MAG TPA: hypothetical protein VE822_13790 [Candidatus Elarobacter sp.]|nr:MAG: hypothetical protein DMG48_06915 [Acidobacteriota bacterium]HYX00181.1 hypothetical protein [Candidatus Elarobacter sp.]